jgi:hypothetical protein
MQTNEQYFTELEAISQLFREKGIYLSQKESIELAIKFSIGQSLNDFNLILHDQGDTNNKIVDISRSLEEIAISLKDINHNI